MMAKLQSGYKSPRRRASLREFKTARVVILFVLLLTAVPCRAETCPWLNAATAGGALGGDVLTNVVHPSQLDVTCEFKLKRESDTSSLTIAVHTMNAVAQDYPTLRNACTTPATSLRGIGNEAIECSSGAAPGTTATEMIVARVRERAFVLKWTFPNASGSIRVVPREELQEKIRNLAEQVAGSLF